MKWPDGLDLGNGFSGLGSSSVYLRDTLTTVTRELIIQVKCQSHTRKPYSLQNTIINFSYMTHKFSVSVEFGEFILGTEMGVETLEPEVVQHKLRLRLIERCNHLSEEVGRVIFAYNYCCVTVF